MGRMDGKHVVITQANAYMGPAAAEIFAEEGAKVIADERDLTKAGAAEALIAEAGHIDVLIANLAPTARHAYPAHEMPDESWDNVFATLVHPLHHLCRAVLPQMYARKAGKIIVFGSIAGLKKVDQISAYATARTAQVGYVRNVGSEAAQHNVQINLIAQHFVEHAFFSPKFQQTDRFKSMMAGVPAGRLASVREDIELALFLASQHSNFIVGEAIPFTGGWHH